VEFENFFTQPYTLDLIPNGLGKLDNHDRLGWLDTLDGSDRPDNTNG